LKFSNLVLGFLKVLHRLLLQSQGSIELVGQDQLSALLLRSGRHRNGVGRAGLISHTRHELLDVRVLLVRSCFLSVLEGLSLLLIDWLYSEVRIEVVEWRIRSCEPRLWSWRLLHRSSIAFTDTDSFIVDSWTIEPGSINDQAVNPRSVNLMRD